MNVVEYGAVTGVPSTTNRALSYPPLVSAQLSKYGGRVDTFQSLKSLPTAAVRYPASLRSCSSVLVWSRLPMPVCWVTCVLWAYRPDRMVERLGQQLGVVTTAFG